MGKYFMMSMHFNKKSAQDFGLIRTENDLAINPNDNTLWKKSSLYDFGWGKENGYYKLPALNFSQLLYIALQSNCDEDRYGAVAMILDVFPQDLLEYCESIMNTQAQLPKLKKIVKLFSLKVPINRCSILQKSYEQIEEEYKRWKKISDFTE